MKMTQLAKVRSKADLQSLKRDDAKSVKRTIEEDGTVVFPLSSEEPYPRWYWEHGELDEILSHDTKAVDLSFLNSGHAPLLDSHRSHSGLAFQIGVVREAWLENDRVYVRAAFSNRDEAQAVKKDVAEGIISNVSVGYQIDRYEVDEDARTFTATRWKPTEASFVPIPADTTVGVGRIAERKGDTMSAAKLPGVGDDAPTEEERAEALTTTLDEISALASEHNMGDIGRSYVKGVLETGGTPSLAMFRGIVASKLPEGTPLVNTDVGLTDKERQDFSLTNIARHYETAKGGKEYAGFELEVSEAARKIQSKAGITDHGGFVLPTEVLRNYSDFTVDGVNSTELSRMTGQQQRAPISTTSNPNIQTTDHLAGSFIDNLRNVSAVLGAGMFVMDGLDNNVEIPGADQNAEVFWLAAEDDEVAETNLTQRLVTLSPKDLGAYIHFTRRMLQQNTVSVENLARMDLLIAHSLGIDLAALYGAGAAGVPLGITNTPGIGSVTFAGATPTRGEIIDLRTAIAATNRGRGVEYLGNSIMVGDLQKTDVQPGSPTGQFLMNNSADRLVGNGFRESNQITDGDLITGAFGDAILGMWGGLQLDRSTEQRFLRAGVTLRSIQTVDVAVRRVGSFALGNDGV